MTEIESDDVILSTPPGVNEVVQVGPADDRSSEAVNYYVESQLSTRSQQNARDALNRIARLVKGAGARAEDFPWPAISMAIAKMIRRKLFDLTTNEVIKPGTANLTLSHLRGMVRGMYDLKFITHEQLSIAHPGMVRNVTGSRALRGENISAENEAKLRAAARDLDGYHGPMLDAAITLAIGAGLRREEVAEAVLERLKGDRLSIIGKGNVERGVIIDPQMRATLDAWLRERAELAPTHGNLFCSPWHPNEKLSRWSFWTSVRQAAHAAFGTIVPCADGCQCLETLTGPHDFRRTFATRLFRQDFDIREIQVLMGHKSPETTARYDKRSEEELLKKRRGTRVIA